LSRVRGSVTNNNGFWIGWLDSLALLLQLQSAHNRWLSKTRSIPYWTTSVFSSTVTDLVLIYESVTSSAFVVRWLTLRSWTLNHDCNLTDFSFMTALRMNDDDFSFTNEWLERRLSYVKSEFECYITTDGQSASLSWNKTPVWDLRPDFYYCQTVASLLMWGALSDERTDLSFPIAPGPRQRSHFRVRLPWDSWPYFTVSDSKLPFSSPPITGRVTVEVLDPASTRESESITCPFISRCEPNTEHHLQQSVCHYLFHPLLRNVCQYLGNALISTSVFVATKRGFSEPLSSNGLFRHNI
jgi:hypothetical protein